MPPARNQAPTSIGGSTSGRLAGIASADVGGLASVATAAGGVAGGGTTTTVGGGGGGIAIGAAGGAAGAAGGVSAAWARATPAAPVSRIASVVPQTLDGANLRRSFIFFSVPVS